jgi:hypothetical protein
MLRCASNTTVFPGLVAALVAIDWSVRQGDPAVQHDRAQQPLARLGAQRFADALTSTYAWSGSSWINWVCDGHRILVSAVRGGHAWRQRLAGEAVPWLAAPPARRMANPYPVVKPSLPTEGAVASGTKQITALAPPNDLSG